MNFRGLRSRSSEIGLWVQLRSFSWKSSWEIPSQGDSDRPQEDSHPVGGAILTGFGQDIRAKTEATGGISIAS